VDRVAAKQLLSVVVPVFNEAPTVKLSLERLLKTELPLATEIIVVDDGSTDGGIEAIRDFVDGGAVTLVSHERNRGKGAAVRTGVREANGDLITICDADLEYDPGDYVLMLQPILEGESQVVYGTRAFGAQNAYSFWYVIGNRCLALWASFLFNAWVSDIETCFKIMEADVWRSLGLRSSGFGIEAEVTGKLLKRNFRIFEQPITYRARSREEGKKLSWMDGLQALWILLRIRLFSAR
jgi:glycosyltransferase involved in cell wall biosynthesis